MFRNNAPQQPTAMDEDDGDRAAAAPPPLPPGGTPGTATPAPPMSDKEQSERRASIRDIMSNKDLSEYERRRSIQSLMDGRRRSSGGTGGGAGGRGSISMGGGMAAAAAAAAAAADFGSAGDSDEDDDDESLDLADTSVASSLTGSAHGSRRGSHAGSRRGSQTGGIRRSSLRESFNLSFSNMGFASANGSGGGGGGGGGGDETVSSSGGELDSHGLPAHGSGAAIGSSRRMERHRPECEHYERNCTIISPCCGLAFGCRICHDDCAVLPPPIFLKEGKEEEDGGEGDGHDQESSTSGSAGMQSEGAQTAPGGGLIENMKKRGMARSSSLPTSFHEEDTHHNIDRFAIKEVICRECYTRQSSKTNNCIKCGIQFGAYHCSICNLWMSDEEEPYHCPDCGFCRVGGRENFRHCHDCGMCIDSLLFDDHNCKTGKYMSNCPVCQEDLFSSRSASHEMPCGHAIHWHCFRELTSFDTRCPVCKKTAETHEQMAPTWSAMAMGIALQPVPPDLARVVNIICNDCEERDEDRRWHFLGVQCTRCTSFNTTIESTTLVGHEAAAFLGDDDPQGGGQFVGAAAGGDAGRQAMDVNALDATASGGGGGGVGQDMRFMGGRSQSMIPMGGSGGLGGGGTAAAAAAAAAAVEMESSDGDAHEMMMSNEDDDEDASGRDGSSRSSGSYNRM